MLSAKIALSIAGLVVILQGCNEASTSEPSNYIESEPSFFELRHGDWLTNTWVRKPENLLRIHETFKKVGYRKLITDNLLFADKIIIQDIYINKQGSHLLDSLEIAYDRPDNTSDYYVKFWQRRKLEKNDSAVYVIIKDINHAIKHDILSDFQNPQLVNDTLFNLLNIEFRTDRLTERLAQQDFEILKRMGFHQSAYNLLFERYKYHELGWNRDSLAASLTKTEKVIYPWFEDDTK